MMNPFLTVDEARILALEIVNTIPDPFLVLDSEFRVLAASRSFHDTFKVDPEETRGRTLYELGDGQWDIPALRLLLETIIPDHAAMDAFEVEQDFPEVGHRVMLLNARQLLTPEGEKSTILLAFRDVTDGRAIEREKQELLVEAERLLSQNRILLQELQHRVRNSLQIIASILLLKARAVASIESRGHLEDAYERVMSVALVQAHLSECEGMVEIEIGAFLSKLCDSLASSMSDENRPITIEVLSDEGLIASSNVVSIGLIVTELVINAVKYAFPNGGPDSRILVTYEADGADWKLTISDNGVGKAPQVGKLGGGLGTMIVDSLVRQLGAAMDEVSGKTGVSVSIVSPTFKVLLPQAA
ncbi:sensor histidine kinase [Lichenifustis flavocetrariae]|uniref:histidine kinase n=1 Tax=Lichenifustis flavocetrariae TaxID=2949735 RepID=A0AA41Z1A1_9HYPH|nr:histidine kinase dimerization/phosphoacceptor domain -containing protein [Lichenifustis flavocetrariae]MCW6511889.1 PAS domain-containing protein [Lichenifustis flavocetrariae]